ncbi:hypothetical protein K8T06_03605 [bacterium]|nr:hypothetical protein [bacterium]
MKQTKVSLREEQIHFLKNYSQFGFKDRSEMVRGAIDILQQSILQKQLRESAEIYAEIYQEDQELQELTESALSEWPE